MTIVEKFRACGMTLVLILTSAAPATQSTSYAFTDVTVIPMDRERAIAHQTVIVRDGRIAAIGDAAATPVPNGALRIDATGKYLLPGLHDMHAHLLGDLFDFPNERAEDELMIMLANGVTTARIMIGRPEHLGLRRRIAVGELLAPTLFVASPQFAGRSFGEPHFNGYVVATPDSARAAVRRAKAAGYDFIKLTFFISRPVYDAVIDEARAQGIRVIGHVDAQVGLARALEAGQQIEHLDSYFQAVLADDAPFKRSVDGVDVWRMANWASLDNIDDTKIARVAGATAHAAGWGRWSTPTLTFLERAFGTGQSDEEVTSRPDYRFFPAAIREEMSGPRRQFWSAPPSDARRKRFVAVRNRLVKAIHDSGGKILAGSDAPEWFLLYGYTLHRELQHLVTAGLTPFQALEAATRNPAEFLGTLASTGTIAAGKRADLLLLDGDPLASITNTTRIAGVMRRGRWLPRATLDTALAAIANRFRGRQETSSSGEVLVPRVARAVPDSGLRSADWLGLLPDGEEKRHFIVDCTGCHQIDARHVMPNGKPRTEAQWDSAITRMLGYAGATTGFPVISHAREARATAHWLAQYMTRVPTPAVSPSTPGAEITEFTVPIAGDLPHDVAVDKFGRVIITGMFSHQMYVLDPRSGTFSTEAIPVEKANPRALEIDAQGNWWVVLGNPHMLARFTPSTRRWSTYPVGMYPHSLALDSAGQVWFNGHFTRAPEQIGRVRVADGETKTFDVPAHPTLAALPGGPIPYEIRVGPDGRIWGSELNGDRIYAFTPSTGRFETFAMPKRFSGPRRLDVDANGIVWIPAYGANELVRFDPKTKTFATFPLPMANAIPYVVRVDPATNRVWVAASSADVIFLFDPGTQRFASYPLPSRGALVRHLTIDPATRDLWIAYGASPSTIGAKVARLRLR